jgi:hypothetical protein
METYRHRACSELFSVPPVSKQSWFKAAAAFLNSSTFDFEDSEAFFSLATSGQAHISLIHRICIRNQRSIYSFSYGWGTALNISFQELFKGARCVNLQLEIDAGEADQIVTTGLMQSSYWGVKPLLRALRSSSSIGRTPSPPQLVW